MSAPLAELQKIGIKLFAADGAAVRPRELVPIFHRWIQSGAVADHLLVDVADYEHVPEGPGVMLIAHEGQFSLDLGGGRMGWCYARKQPLPGALPDRLRAIARIAIETAQRLEQEPALAGRLRFRTDQLALFANDRLRAPNSRATLESLQPSLRAFLQALYGDAACTITAEADPRERFGVHVAAANGSARADLR